MKFRIFNFINFPKKTLGINPKSRTKNSWSRTRKTRAFIREGVWNCRIYFRNFGSIVLPPKYHENPINNKNLESPYAICLQASPSGAIWNNPKLQVYPYPHEHTTPVSPRPPAQPPPLARQPPPPLAPTFAAAHHCRLPSLARTSPVVAPPNITRRRSPLPHCRLPLIATSSSTLPHHAFLVGTFLLSSTIDSGWNASALHPLDMLLKHYWNSAFLLSFFCSICNFAQFRISRSRT
jgi:hypothetical protein